MKVKLLANGKTEEYNDGYCARLIEQGKAVPVEEKAEKPAKTEGKK